MVFMMECQHSIDSSNSIEKNCIFACMKLLFSKKNSSSTFFFDTNEMKIDWFRCLSASCFPVKRIIFSLCAEEFQFPSSKQYPHSNGAKFVFLITLCTLLRVFSLCVYAEFFLLAISISFYTHTLAHTYFSMNILKWMEANFNTSHCTRHTVFSTESTL